MIDNLVPQRDERSGVQSPARALVGRGAEVDRLRAFLAAASSHGGALLVTGEPGVGKTELLDAAADLATDHDALILRASGVEFEAEMSFSSLNQVLLPLLSGLPRLPGVHRDALNVALGFGEGAPPSRLVVSNATLVLLRDAAASRPLLVILDDLPWLDRASAGVLSFVARRLGGSKVGLLGAARAGELDVFDHVGLPELVVEPLDVAASRHLLDTRYPDLAPAVRDRILEEAEGNPLALEELPAALGPGGRSSGDSLPSSLPLSRRLQDVFGSRIADLPRPTVRLLLHIALDGTGDLRVLGAGGGPSAGLRDLAPAEQAGLAYLDETTRRLTFRHPLIRASVVELSSAADRRDAHRVLAEAWVDQPDRRAWHLSAATVGPDESVAAELEAAATRILARGDAVGCVRTLTRASELSPQTAERRRRMAAAAYIAADVTGDLNNALQVLTELRRGDTEVEGTLHAAIAASVTLLQVDGDVATAYGLLVAALASHEGPLDASHRVVAEALYSLMMVCRYGAEEDRWRTFETAMARSVSIPPLLELSRQTFANPAYAGAAVLEELETAIATLVREADPTQIIRIGRAATYVDRIEGCRPALWRVVDDARRGGAVASGITAMFLLGRHDWDTGEWDEAELLAEEAIHACEEHGYHAVMWPCRYLQALVAAARGDDERARELTDDLIRWTAPRGIRVGEWFACQALGLAALGRGEFEEAYRRTSLISRPGLLAPYAPGALYVLMDLVEAALHTGREADAAAHVAAMRDANLAALSERLALVVGGCTAMVAADDRASDLFEQTLALPGIERWRWDLARVRLAYGERLRRHRAMTQARAQLNVALETFELLGARPWVERTTAELRATGQTKPHTGENVIDRLTPQEHEIVTLAASGLTNKQIGERLYLSHRTVGGHLHRAFPKLGVSTRAALRDALESLPPEQLPRD